MMRRLKKILLHPGQTMRLANRRYFHLGLSVKDPEIHEMKGWAYGALPREPLPHIFPGIDAVSYSIIRGYARTSNMSLSVAELNAVAAIMRHVGAETAVEIGTYDGGTTLTMAANVPDHGRIYTIDLPPESGDGYRLPISGFNDNRTPAEQVGTQYRNNVHASKIVQILSDSAAVDYSGLHPPHDVFLIDGCHDYRYVEHDSLQAWKFTRPGGVIIWHDYGMLPDVSRYVDGWSRDHEVRAVAGTRLAVATRT
jgi:hypothetical protein